MLIKFDRELKNKKIYGLPIIYVYKYLGILIDNKDSVHKQINFIVNR